MNRLAQRLWPQRITTQIVLLTTTSVIISHVVIAAAAFALYPREIPVRAAWFDTIKLAYTAKLVAQTGDAALRKELIELARRNLIGLELGGLPIGARPAAAGRQLIDMRAQLGPDYSVFEIPSADGSTDRVAVLLPDGQAIIAKLSPLPPLVTPAAPLIVTLIFMALAIALLSFWAARTLTAPLSRFADAAEGFTVGHDDVRLPERGPKEVVRAARALNEMRERVQRMMKDRAQMLAAISHDLRTPITRLRLRAEDIKPAELREQVIADLDTIQVMTKGALSFLRDQAAREPHVRVDVSSLVQTLCDNFEDVGHKIWLIAGQQAHVCGNPEQLARAVTNLIENGLKFGKTVTVTMLVRSSVLHIDVRDDGPGIADAEKPRVLEPFYRIDKARGLSANDSYGLGLSIAHAIADAHDGTLSLHDARPTGLIARLTLPLDESIGS